MLAGLVNAIGRIGAAARGLSKVALGTNPNSPFDITHFLKNFFPGNSGAVHDARLDNRPNWSIVDQMTRGSANPPPPPSQKQGR